MFSTMTGAPPMARTASTHSTQETETVMERLVVTASVLGECPVIVQACKRTDDQARAASEGPTTIDPNQVK
jgi:hypothetical protein